MRSSPAIFGVSVREFSGVPEPRYGPQSDRLPYGPKGDDPTLGVSPRAGVPRPEDSLAVTLWLPRVSANRGLTEWPAQQTKGRCGPAIREVALGESGNLPAPPSVP